MNFTLGNFNVPERTLQEETVDDNEEPPEVDHIDVTSGFTQKATIPVFRGTLDPTSSHNTSTSRGPLNKDSKAIETMGNSSLNHMVVSTTRSGFDEEEKHQDDEEEKIYAAVSLMPFISFGFYFC